MLSGVSPISNSSGSGKKHTVGELVAETEKMVRQQFKGMQNRTLTDKEEAEVKRLAKAICFGTLKDMGKI